MTVPVSTHSVSTLVFMIMCAHLGQSVGCRITSLLADAHWDTSVTRTSDADLNLDPNVKKIRIVRPDSLASTKNVRIHAVF
jgi:hypothetical protein